ncbi:uncharacterized protein CIMG_04949 [Coccidioides immitis RS]|uniref:Uncharacterized protein n=2 Tax=Coccidioides immitis TaxID=5501 RepID=J3KEK3_COCIM|nr:uncharacterized protein CIMG_04949 [Coccidioides immitis RS]EAS33925.3 hypothetical protein CIMG_04949 [Coccidioides immitis RS]KMP05132.1 hypothetical protein CIRG_04813 [Coccidioides immitis RMSCC 2394]
MPVCKEKLALSLHATVNPTTSRSSNGSTYQKLPNKINTCDTNHADIMAFLDWVDFPKRTPLPNSPPSTPLNQFVRMIADTNLNIKTDRATIVRGIRQFSVLWLPIGRIGGSRFLRIVPCIYGLRPEVPPLLDFDDIFPQSVLGVDDNIRPGTAFHSCGEKLPGGKANLSGPGDLDAGGFNCFQLEILQSLGGEIDKPLSYEDADEGEWCSTRFYAVVRFGPDGLERGIYAILNCFRPDDEDSEHDFTPDHGHTCCDYLLVSGRFASKRFSLAELPDNIQDLGFSKAFELKLCGTVSMSLGRSRLRRE